HLEGATRDRTPFEDGTVVGGADTGALECGHHPLPSVLRLAHIRGRARRPRSRAARIRLRPGRRRMDAGLSHRPVSVDQSPPANFSVRGWVAPGTEQDA